MQQLKIIEHFVKKNHPNTKVIGCKTIREKNGIACVFIKKFFAFLKSKNIASKIYKLLNDIENKI